MLKLGVKDFRLTEDSLELRAEILDGDLEIRYIGLRSGVSERRPANL